MNEVNSTPIHRIRFYYFNLSVRITARDKVGEISRKNNDKATASQEENG